MDAPPRPAGSGSRRPPARPRRGVRLLVVVAGVLVTWSAVAPPVGAHAGDADRATNYRTVITDAPDLPGLSVRLVDAGAMIEVAYAGPGEVVVSGYAGEPFRRIGPDGVEENRQSPAAWLDASLTADVTVPPEVDPRADPEWVHLSDIPSTRWHDHRAHWMGVVDPPAVAAAPRDEHVVIEHWEIPLEVDGRPAAIRGEVRWVPGPSPWLWAVVLPPSIVGAAVLFLTRTWGLAAGKVLLGVVVVGSMVLGTLRSPVGPPAWWLGLLGAALVALAASVAVAHRRPRAAAALAAAAGVGVLILVGVVERGWLVRSRLPVDAAPALGRALVAAAIVSGSAVALTGVWRAARRGQPMRALWPPSTGRTAPVTKSASSDAR